MSFETERRYHHLNLSLNCEDVFFGRLVTLLNKIYVLEKCLSVHSGCTCNGNAVISDAAGYPNHNSCQKKCKETNTCEYFGVWDNGHCMGWDKCGSCQSSGYKNVVYKLESCGKSFYLKAMR